MPSRLRIAARLSIAAGVCLVVGAATTVGSIVFLATRPPLGGTVRSFNSCSASWAVTGGMAIFMLLADKGPAYQGYLIGPPLQSAHGEFLTRDWRIPIGEFLPPEATAAAYDKWSRMSPGARLVEFYGWPQPAAYSISDLSSLSNGTREVFSTTGRQLAGFAHARLSEKAQIDAVIPLQPLWPGLLMNTAVFLGTYALLLAGALAPGTVRRLRRRRGLCPSCGYSREGLAGDSACPECGAAPSRTLTARSPAWGPTG